MKTYKYIALAVFALSFTACSQDDDFTPQQEDIVKIASANIATEVQTRVNTLEDGTLWENADQILLVNNSRTTKNSGTYTATVTTGDNSTTTWQLTNGTVLYTSGTNDFTAYYPAVTEADYILPIDQSTVAGIKIADRMVATTTGVTNGDAVALSFERLHAKVTITPTFASEYNGKVIADIQNFKIEEVTPYLPENSTAYTAILEPLESGFTVTLTVGSDNLTATSTTALEAGKHYTFSLTVGKEALTIDKVNVTPWTEIPVTGVESEEYFSPYVDATSLTEIQLEKKLLTTLNAGNTDITVTLAADANEEMFTAINNALNNSIATESSIDLTIAGAQVIPYDALGNGHPDSKLNTDPTALKTLNLPDAVKLEANALSLPNVQAVYLPKVTEWVIWGIWNADNITTLVLTAPGTITADFFDLYTENIDLTLHKDKESEVTNGNQWCGETWKSITFAE